MGAIAETTIAEIKERTDIADLISSYGITVRRAGSGYKALCPFHHEKTPSFDINPRTGRWHCFGCGESGDSIRFVQMREGLDFLSAVARLADRCGVTLEDREDADAITRRKLIAIHAEAEAFFRRCLLKAKEASKARQYLASRRLDGDVAERFGIGYVPISPEALLKWADKHGYTPEDMTAAGLMLPPKEKGGRWFSRFAGRIAFPIRDRMGRTVAFSCRAFTEDTFGGKYVNSPETDIFRKSNVLFGLDKAAPEILKASGRQVILCEGQIDTIRCHTCGFPTAVASQGTAFTQDHVRLLKRCADSALLVFDGDGAGRKAALKAAQLFLLSDIPVKAVALPPGEDPDSILLDKGPDAFRELISKAVSPVSFLLEGMEEGFDTPERQVAAARKVIALLKGCPSSVMRESLMAEAGAKIGLSVASIRDDLAKEETKGARQDRHPHPAEGQPLSAEPAKPSASADKDATPVMPTPRELSHIERSLCHLLLHHEKESALLPDAKGILSAQALSPLASAILKAWIEGIETGNDGIAAFMASSSEGWRGEASRLMLSDPCTVESAFSPERLMSDFRRILAQSKSAA